MIKRMSFDAIMHFLNEATEKAKDCTECRKCVNKCPYNLDIPILLKENIFLWKNSRNKF